MSLCLMPDGTVHLEQHHAACDYSETQGQTASWSAEEHQLDNCGPCLDIPLEKGASIRHQKNLTQLPIPAIAPLGPPISLAQTGELHSPGTQPDISPQLQPLRSVFILRI